jgi:hypothetical protein
MGQLFFPNSILFATALQLQAPIKDNWACNTDETVPRHFTDFTPYAVDIADYDWYPSDEHFIDASNGGGPMMLGPSSWSPNQYDETGGGGRGYIITGVVKDEALMPRAGVRCLLRQTIDNWLVAETVSDTNGIYGFQVQDIVTNYYVEALQNAPPISGISARTLTGA